MLTACTELATTPASHATITPAVGALAPPSTLYDGERRHVAVTLTRADGAPIGTDHVSWTSNVDSVVHVDAGAVCATDTSTFARASHACLIARSPGTVQIKVTLAQPGLATVDTTFKLTVTQRWIDLAASTGSVCAINVKYQLFCWGAKELVGTGKAKAELVPRAVLTAGMQYERVYAGGTAACGVPLGTALAYCWGHNAYGAAGLGPTVLDAPVPTLPLNAPFLAIAIGPNASCGIRASGAVSCWGLLLGDAASVASVPCQDEPSSRCVYGVSDWITIRDLRESATSVGVGGYHGCIGAGPAVQCWGSNRRGQLGRGTIDSELLRAPFATLSLGAGRRADVALAFDHSCAVLGADTNTDRSTWCWGSNDRGESGIATCAATASGYCDAPTPVRLPVDFRAIALGFQHGCGVQASGVVQCWGSNEYGQLGRGTATDTLPHVAPAPVRIESIRRFDRIASSDTFVCALTVSDGAIYCWGGNIYGNLGTGDVIRRDVPTRVAEPFTSTLTVTPGR